MSRSESEQFHLLALLLLKPRRTESFTPARLLHSSALPHTPLLLVSLSLLSYLTTVLRQTRRNLPHFLLGYFLSSSLGLTVCQKLRIYAIFLHNPVSRIFQAVPGKKITPFVKLPSEPEPVLITRDFKENQTSILSLATARASTMSNSAGSCLWIMIGHGLDECVSCPCLVCVCVLPGWSHIC